MHKKEFYANIFLWFRYKNALDELPASPMMSPAPPTIDGLLEAVDAIAIEDAVPALLDCCGYI